MGDVRLPYGVPVSATQKLTVSTTAVGLTVPSGATAALVYVEDQPVRWQDDGTAPTATTGVLAKADSTVRVEAHSLGAIKFIRQGGVDATLEIAFYKGPPFEYGGA